MIEGHHSVSDRNGDDFGLARSLEDIRHFYRPRTGVALVGRVDVSPGWMATYRSFGEEVKIAFVNPKGGEQAEIPIFRSIMELPDVFDTVVIRVSPERTGAIVRECGARGIRTVVVFTNGFAETGSEGAAIQADLARIAGEAGVRLIGPNTPTGLLEQLPLPPGHRGGLIGLITQSGANGRLLVQGTSMGAAFGRWISTGNEADLEAADFINYLAHEDGIAAIGMYIEGFKSYGRLRAAFENANARAKPIVVLKVGATQRGAMAATSHTGHLAGADAVIGGLFEQFGVTRVDDLDALLETTNLFAKLPPGTGPRCALYSYSGGAAAIMGEMGEAFGIPMPDIALRTREELQACIQSNFGIKNPIDNGGLLMHEPADKRIAALDAIANDPSIDIVVVGIGTGEGHFSTVMAQDLRAWAPTAPKPVVAIWAAASTAGSAYQDLVASGVPIFHSFTRCFEALRSFAGYQARVPSFRRRPSCRIELSDAQREQLRAEGVLTHRAATTLVTEAGVRMARDGVAGSPAAARDLAREIGRPVVLKIVSSAFPHKSDVGLVKIGVELDEVATEASALLAKAERLDPRAVIEGVQVQERIDAGGVEMIVGLTHDPQCGPCLTVGFGGVYAELLRDVATRPLPVDREDVREMIASLRLAPLLEGWRGAPRSDVEALIDMAKRVADLGLAADGALIELDLNPVIVQPSGAIAVDVLAVAGAARREWAEA